MTAPCRDDVQAWAFGVLSIDAAATPSQVRVAGLRLVGTAEFAPTFDDAIAAGIAMGRSRDPVATFVREVYFSRTEDALGKAIDEFGRSFFDLPVDERFQRWRALADRTAAFPWWRSRLDDLQPGLDVDRPERAGRLARLTLEMFALPARERAARRREGLASLRLPPVGAEEIRIFEQSLPNVAKLAGDLLAELRARPMPRRTK